MARSVARRITQLSRSDIIRLMRKGRYIYTSPEIDIRVYPTQHDIGRVLIIAPKKIGNAPQRNKVKRRIRAIFYELSLYEYGHDWACFIKKPGVKLSYHDIHSIIEQECIPQLQAHTEKK